MSGLWAPQHGKNTLADLVNPRSLVQTTECLISTRRHHSLSTHLPVPHTPTCSQQVPACLPHCFRTPPTPLSHPSLLLLPLPSVSLFLLITPWNTSLLSSRHPLSPSVLVARPASLASFVVAISDSLHRFGPRLICGCCDLGTSIHVRLPPPKRPRPPAPPTTIRLTRPRRRLWLLSCFLSPESYKNIFGTNRHLG